SNVATRPAAPERVPERALVPERVQGQVPPQERQRQDRPRAAGRQEAARSQDLEQSWGSPREALL
ncbi:MAG: hypothetical protein J2O46_10825, partial [Nocardioides sp.]|nr:hypothetical protein [Nocardioides sp.]